MQKQYIPLLLCVLLLLLTSCAKVHNTTKVSDEKQIWQAFCNQKHKEAPYSLQISIRLGKKGDTRRVTALLWGNTTNTIRLDVMAGVGNIVAKIRRTPDTFVVVTPMESKCYTHNGSNQPRLKLGIPLPLSIVDMTNLLLGYYPDVFGAQYSSFEKTSSGRIRYTLVGNLSGTLELNTDGIPYQWKDAKGWTLRLQTDEAQKPNRFDLTNTRGEQCIVFVKDRLNPQPFTNEALSIVIPPSYPILPLEKYASSGKN